MDIEIEGVLKRGRKQETLSFFDWDFATAVDIRRLFVIASFSGDHQSSSMSSSGKKNISQELEATEDQGGEKP